jgi:hypothetical protein
MAASGAAANDTRAFPTPEIIWENFLNAGRAKRMVEMQGRNLFIRRTILQAAK